MCFFLMVAFFYFFVLTFTVLRHSYFVLYYGFFIVFRTKSILMTLLGEIEKSNMAAILNHDVIAMAKKPGYRPPN